MIIQEKHIYNLWLNRVSLEVSKLVGLVRSFDPHLTLYGVNG